MKDAVIQLPFLEELLSHEDQKDAKEHTLAQCVAFQRIFDKKLQIEEITFENEGALNIHFLESWQ